MLYLGLFPNLLVSAAPRLRDDPPAGAARAGPHLGRVLLVLRRPTADVDPAYAVEFWDLTNRQDWAACESVQRGLASPHFRPGPFAPNEDAVHQWVTLVGRAYRGIPPPPSALDLSRPMCAAVQRVA